MKNDWGWNGKDLTPEPIDPKETRPPPKYIVGCTQRKSTLLFVYLVTPLTDLDWHLLQIIWMHILPIFPHPHRCEEGTKKACGGTTSPVFPPHPVCGGHRIWCVGSAGRRSQMCKISAKSVQGFRNPRGPNMTLLHWLGSSPLQQYALRCDTVTIYPWIKTKSSVDADKPDRRV